MEAFFQTQINIEEKIAQKIEETLKKAKQEEEAHKQELKRLEVEAKIEELKKENEQCRKSKLEKECELLELKAKLKLVNETMEMHSANNNSMGNFLPNRTQAFFPPSNMASPPMFYSPQSNYMPPYCYYPPPHHFSPEMSPYYHPNHFFPNAPRHHPSHSYSQPRGANVSQGTEEDNPETRGHSPMLTPHDLLKMKGAKSDLTVGKTFSEEMSLDNRMDGTPMSQGSINQTPKLPLSRRDLLTTSNSAALRALFKTSYRTNESPSRTSLPFIADEEERPGITKSETFGLGALSQIVSDLRKAAIIKSPARSRTDVAEPVLELANERSRSETDTNNHIASSTHDFNPPKHVAKSDINIPSLFIGTSNNLNTYNPEPTDRTTASIFGKDLDAQTEKQSQSQSQQAKNDQPPAQELKIDLTKAQPGTTDMMKTQTNSSISDPANTQQQISTQTAIKDSIRRPSIRIEPVKYEPGKLQPLRAGSVKGEISKLDPQHLPLAKSGSTRNVFKKADTPTNELTESLMSKENANNRGSQKKVLDLMKKDSLSSADMSNPQRILPSYSKLDIEFEDGSSLKDSPRNEGLFMPNGWHDSLGGGFVSPRPFHILDVPELMNFPEKSILKQAYFGLDEDHNYTIECHFVPKAIDPGLKLVLNQKVHHFESHILMAEELIKIKDLRTILEFIDYKDILPPMNTVKSIKNYKNFIRYFVLPFLWVIYHVVSCS